MSDMLNCRDAYASNNKKGGGVRVQCYRVKKLQSHKVTIPDAVSEWHAKL